LQHGSKQSILNSLNDQQLKQLCDRHYPLECKVAKTFLGRETLFENPYPIIFRTDTKIESNKISSFKKALLRCVVRDIILTSHYQNPNLIQKICVFLWESIPFKSMRGLNYMHKKIVNKLRRKTDSEWLVKMLSRVF